MRKAIAALLAVFLLVLSPTAAAWTSDPNSNPPINKKDKPTTWCQGCSKNPGDYPVEFVDGTKTIGLSSRGPTLKDAGCGNYSFTGLMVRAGVKPRGYSIVEFRHDVETLHSAGKAQVLAGEGWFYQGAESYFAEGLSNMTGGQLRLVSVKNPVNTNAVNGTTTSYKDVIEEWNKGYFVEFMVQGVGSRSGHWISVDYVDGDVVHTIDSGRNTNIFPDPKNYTGEVGYLMSFERTDGKTNKDFPPVDNAATSSSTASASPTKSADVDVITDSDLEGMPPLTEGQKAQLENTKLDLDFTQPSFNNIDVQGKANIVALQGDFQRETDSKVSYYIGGMIGFMSILSFLAGIVLMIAYSLDRTYMVGAVSLVTMGQLDTDSTPPSHIIFGIAAFWLLGALLITGVITDGFATILGWIT